MKRLSFLLFFVVVLSSLAFMPVRTLAAEHKPVSEKPLTRAERKKLEEEKRRKEMEERRKNMPPIKMIYVEGGCFDMGDFTGKGDDDEKPVHKVCLSDYYIGETEVTNRLWEAVMGFPFQEGIDPDMPLTNINWSWANRFIEALNKLVDGFYRLPTEAEWEYAARERGKDIRWSGTNNEDDIEDYGWFLYNSEGKMHYPKQKKPNALGIYDMTGNVWEWVEDNFDFDYYKNSPEENPFGPDFSDWRTIRGGSYVDGPYKLRTTYRHAKEANLFAPNIGFRLAE